MTNNSPSEEEKENESNISENNPNILKVTLLGLDNRIFEEMKKPGFSIKGVTRKLNAEGYKITSQSIRKFIRKSKDAQRALIARDLRTAHELTKTIIDYGNYLKNIIKEVEDMKNLAKSNKDFVSYNQMIDKLYKGVELIAKITGDLKPKGSIDINIIYNEINNGIEKEMSYKRNSIFNTNKIDVDYEIIEEDTRFANDLNKKK